MNEQFYYYYTNDMSELSYLFSVEGHIRQGRIKPDSSSCPTNN